MKAKLLKMSTLTVLGMFVFASASWAENRSNRPRNDRTPNHYGKAVRQPQPFHQDNRWQNHQTRHYNHQFYRPHALPSVNRYYRNHNGGRFQHYHFRHQPVYRHHYGLFGRY